MKDVKLDILNNFNTEKYFSIIDDIITSYNSCEIEDFIPGISKSHFPDIKILENLYEIIIPYIKENYYDNKDIKIIDIKFLKHLKGPYKNHEGAFKWHVDNHPHNILNLIVYLSDVEDNSGGFQFVTENNSIVKIPYRAPSGGKVLENYVPEKIKKRIFKVETVTGKKGTIFIFDNCIIHRASVPLDKDRDALILQISS